MARIEAGLQEWFHPINPNLAKTHGLKYLRYKGPWKDGSTDGIIVYKEFDKDKMVVYSGLTSEGLSTVNAAEKILDLIKKDTKTNLSDFRFFDIQTSKGYPVMSENQVTITEITTDENGLAHFIPNTELSELPEGFFTDFPV
ncbi:MAG TPA: hypothetical protein VMR19_03810 [Candidatus Saccharimonadales bacterium]|jgi:hypothetical protein|nr:hypothetical protein [Candidatus Saccharimonadales bacterium]